MGTGRPHDDILATTAGVLGTGSRNAAPRKDPTFKFKLSRFDGKLNRVRERGGESKLPPGLWKSNPKKGTPC